MSHVAHLDVDQHLEELRRPVDDLEVGNVALILADRGRQATERGSGLGLAITKSLVEAQNGQISVDSTPGEGSKFTIKFPHST